jgi:hypothetical protein
MGTSTSPVSGTLAVIDSVQLGQANIRNVVVMVLPDANFDVGPGIKLPPLLGLPMLQAFGRIAWIDGGKQLALGSAAPPIPAGSAQQLYWHNDGIGLLFATARGSFVAHLDTGANRLGLFSDSLPLLADAERASIARRQSLTGGAGGILKRRQDHVPNIGATIAGVPAVFRDVPVERGLGGSGARLGMDYVAQLSTLALDFTTMRVAAVPKAPALPLDLGFLDGDWILLDPAGKPVGKSHVATLLAGALIHELRTDAQGALPVWFIRTERTGGWSQLFPGPNGDLREFTPLSAPGEWPLILGGDAILRDGREARFKLTLTKDSPDASHRLLEMSTDGGRTWQSIFDYHYRRATTPSH